METLKATPRPGSRRGVTMLVTAFVLVITGAVSVTVKAGTNPALTVRMHDSKDPNAYPTSVDPAEARAGNGVLPPKKEILYASYDEIYPPGPGRDAIERVC
ncbi:MAG: hypothetical protein ABL961_08950, partial [Vicinamibacterales bacterium]